VPRLNTLTPPPTATALAQIFTAQLHLPGERRVENGLTGTVVDVSRHSERLMIETDEREPREVQLNADEFSDLRGDALRLVDLGRPDRRLADRPRARLRRPQPRPRANSGLRLTRGPRRGRHGRRRDRTPGAANAAQRGAGGEHRGKTHQHGCAASNATKSRDRPRAEP
jgi:hypothetical protein